MYKDFQAGLIFQLHSEKVPVDIDVKYYLFCVLHTLCMFVVRVSFYKSVEFAIKLCTKLNVLYSLA